MGGFNGIWPVEYKVLIMPEVVKDKSEGGMYLPETARERQQYAMERGTVMAIGDGFFSDLPGPTPKIGDKVIFNKYAGSLITIWVEGERKECRLCNDKDICAILKEDSHA
jgi:chaperonin GroES